MGQNALFARKTITDGETAPAFFAAPCQQLAPVALVHALPESMLVAPPAATGLIRTFHYPVLSFLSLY